VKENVEEGLMMTNTGLLELWVTSGKANSVSGKANQVTRVSWTCSSYPKLSGSDQGYLRLGPANSISGKANGVIRVASGLPGLP
jgi:hypothetical protein